MILETIHRFGNPNPSLSKPNQQNPNLTFCIYFALLPSPIVYLMLSLMKHRRGLHMIWVVRTACLRSADPVLSMHLRSDRLSISFASEVRWRESIESADLLMDSSYKMTSKFSDHLKALHSRIASLSFVSVSSLIADHISPSHTEYPQTRRLWVFEGFTGFWSGRY